MALYNISSNLMALFKQSWHDDVVLQTIISDLENDPNSHPKYVWSQAELRRNGKLVVGNSL